MRSALVFLILLFASHPSFADSLLLKTGETLKGTLVEKTDSAYVFQADSDGQKKEVPISSVYIADFSDSANNSPKGSAMFYQGNGAYTPSSKKDASGSDKNGDNGSSSDSSGTGMTIFAPQNAVLKKAQDTVALSNERTAEMEKRLEELKGIADGANQ